MQSCYQRPLTIADKAAIMTQLAVPAAALFIGLKIHIVDPKSLSKGALSGRIAMIFASSITQVTLMVKGLNNHGECPHKYWYYSLSLGCILLPTCMGKLSPFFSLSIYATQCFISVTTLQGIKLPPEKEFFDLAGQLDQCKTQDQFMELHKKFISVLPSLMDQKNSIHHLFEKLLNQWISLVERYTLIQTQLVEELYNNFSTQQKNELPWIPGANHLNLFALSLLFVPNHQRVHEKIDELSKNLAHSYQDEAPFKDLNTQTVDYLSVLKNIKTSNHTSSVFAEKHFRALFSAWIRFIVTHCVSKLDRQTLENATAYYHKAHIPHQKPKTHAFNFLSHFLPPSAFPHFIREAFSWDF